MVYGAIDFKEKKYYTYLYPLFEAIDNQQLNYNWLITDYEGCPQNEKVDAFLSQEYCWISGEELTKIIEEEDFQWIWGLLLGFEKDIPLSEILESPIPSMENATYWKNPITLQHEHAVVEIIAFDSSLTVFKSKEKWLVDKFRSYYKESEDLKEYNKNY